MTQRSHFVQHQNRCELSGFGADFSHADETLVASAGMDNQRDEAAKFVGANLSGAKVTARFSLDDTRGANLFHLKASADVPNQSMGSIRTDFSRANLADANFEGAEMACVNFEFAKLQRANLSGADLSNADFAGADLTELRPVAEQPLAVLYVTGRYQKLR